MSRREVHIDLEERPGYDRGFPWERTVTLRISCAKHPDITITVKPRFQMFEKWKRLAQVGDWREIVRRVFKEFDDVGGLAIDTPDRVINVTINGKKL